MIYKYIFKDVYCEGERIPFVRTEADNEDAAINKVVNYLMKKFNRPQKDFSKIRYFLKDNILKGMTEVKLEPSQSEINFESHYNEED